MALPQAKDMSHSLDPARIRSLEGFGKTASSDSYLFSPISVDDVKAVFELARQQNRKVTLRGAGKSYGDLNIANEALALSLSRMNQILSWDRETGVIVAQAGATIEDIWRTTLQDGWWPAVVSGTMKPTLGGALAANIHGKNSFKEGTLGEHVQEIEVVFPTGEAESLTPDDARLYAIISGVGLLGVITKVTLQMNRVYSGDLRVVPVSCRNLEEQFNAFESFESDADYRVTWIDCFAKGKSIGRGLFHAAFYGQSSEPSTLREDHQDLPDTILGFIPKSITWRILRKFNSNFGMRLLNSVKYRSSKLMGDGKQYRQSLVGFSFLLDYVPNWQNAYLPGGLIQYQCFGPKERARQVFEKLLQMQHETGIISYLGVMKRHRPDRFLFSHGVDGYSLALDFKASSRNWTKLRNLCRQMNQVVLKADGRFYFAKDSTLEAADVQHFLGEVAISEFRKLKAEVDPDGLLTNTLAERVGLILPSK